MIKAFLLAVLCGIAIGIPALAGAVEPASSASAATPQHITTSHGYALYGDLKYPAGFTHFSFVNPNAPKGGTVHIGGLGSYDSFNTFTPRGTSAISIVNFFFYYDTLMRGGGDDLSTAYCLLCETLTYPDDFAWVEFKLRKNGRWHDGKPITVEDVIFTFNTMKEKASPAWNQGLLDIERAEQTGPWTVRFIAAKAGNRRLPTGLFIMAIVPKHYWEGKDFTAPVVTPPLGSGPYRISAFDLGRSVTYTRDPDYWGKDLPVNKGFYNYDKIIYDYYRDSVAEFEAFKANYTDVRLEIDSCNWAQRYTWPAVHAGQVIKGGIAAGANPLYQGFYFNMRRPEFRDAKLREGLSYAFDFTWLNKNLMCDQFVPGRSLFGTGELAAKGLPSKAELALLEPYRDKVPERVFTTEFNPPLTDGTQESLRENLRKGAQILAAAGYTVKDGKLISPITKRPLAFEILLWDPALQRPAMNWAENLKLLGVQATLRTVDFPGYQRRMDEFDFQVMIGLIPFLSSPGQELRNILSSKSADLPNTFNWAAVKDPVVDALVEKMISAKTRPELLAAAHALDRVMMWNFYTLPNYSGRGQYNVGYWDRFGRPDKGPSVGFPYLNTWWIDPAKDAAFKRNGSPSN